MNIIYIGGFFTTFLQGMKYQNNKTLTTNGENAYKSTLDPILDYFSGAAHFRYNTQDIDLIKLFTDAMDADELLAMKALFYSRDISKGMGEKDVPVTILIYLAKHKPTVFKKVISLVPHYGSFNDLRKIIGSDKLTYREVSPVLEFLDDQLDYDMHLYDNGDKDKISLCAKWMPSMGSENKIHKIGLTRFLRYINLTDKPRLYRKKISTLRKHLDIVETKMSDFRYEDIDYSKVPSQAFRKYSEAFERNDGDKFREFLDKANNGEVKVNAGTIHTNQLVKGYIEELEYSYNEFDIVENDATEAQWKNLPKLDTDNKPNVLTMVDVSGSMFNGTAINVAVSLGIYMAENSEGEFKDHIMSFSDDPRLIELDRSKSLLSRTRKILREDVGYSTDLEKAFKLVLNTALANNSKQEDLPEMIIALTDMQMNQAMDYRSVAMRDNELDDSFIDKMKNLFEYHGYKLPYVIWWDTTSDNSSRGLPVTKFDKNTAIVSGFSQSLFNIIMNLDIDGLTDMTPKSLMLDALNSERYQLVEDKLDESVSNKLI